MNEPGLIKKSSKEEKPKKQEETVEESKARRHEKLSKVFQEAVKSKSIAHYELYYRRVAADEFIIHPRSQPGTAYVSVINDTVTFKWRPALTIFLQNDEARIMLFKVYKLNKIFGCNSHFFIEHYDLHNKNSEKKKQRESVEVHEEA